MGSHILFAGTLRMNAPAASGILQDLALRLPDERFRLEGGQVELGAFRRALARLRVPNVRRAEHEALLALGAQMEVAGHAHMTWTIDSGAVGKRALRDAEKEQVLANLIAAWKDMPELRLGQMLTLAAGPDLFLVDDTLLIDRVESFRASRLACPHDTPGCKLGARCAHCLRWPGR